jgi:FkbM family methyltransferase
VSGIKALVRGALVRMLRRRGYAVVRDWELADLRDKAAKFALAGGGPPELLRHVLARLACDGVLDVGANRGQFHDRLRAETGFTGLIVSYEPIPELAASLLDRASTEPGWEVRASALGACAGTRDLHVTAADEFSSFHAPAAGQPSRFAATNRVMRRVAVPVSTLAVELERLRRDRGVARPFVKLDTQGEDLEVLAGAGDSLRSVVGLQSEVSLVALYDGAPGWLESIRTIEGLGFRLAGVFPVAVDVATCRAVELDCVFVRPDAVSPPD